MAASRSSVHVLSRRLRQRRRSKRPLLLERLEPRHLLTGISLLDTTFFGGAGDQRGTDIDIRGGGVYVTANVQPEHQNASAQALVIKYGTGPSAPPQWSRSFASGTNFFGVAAAGNDVYGAGQNYSLSNDPVGGKEVKSILAKFANDGSSGAGPHGSQWISTPNLFGYSGVENNLDVAAAEIGGTDFLYTIGHFQACGNGNVHAILKYDTAGNLLASATEQSPETLCPGRSDGRSIVEVNDAIYAIGNDGYTGTARGFLVKHDANLNRVWRVRDNSVVGSFRGVAGMGGDLYVVGNTTTGAPGGEDYLIEKFDSAGNQIWTSTAGGANTDILTGVVGVSGRLFVSGYTNSSGAGGEDMVIMEIDPATGAVLSTDHFGGTQDDRGTRLATDGTDLYVVGESRSFGVGGNAIGQNDVVIWRFGLAAAQPVWTQIAPNGPLPPVRIQHHAVYNDVNNRMIVFGGTNDAGVAGVPPLLNDTWVLSNADGTTGTPTWTQLSPTGVPPTARSENGYTYDPISNRLLLYGGNDNVGFNSGPVGDYWILTNADGTGGTPAWIPLSPTGPTPGDRGNHAIHHDPTTNRTILFGGVSDNGVLPPGLWILENANGLSGTPNWITPATTGSAPAGVALHSSVYDEANNRLITFAGFQNVPNPALVNRVYVLANANGLDRLTGLPATPHWTQLNPLPDPVNGVPAPVFGHEAVYDSDTNTMTTFGGCCNGPAPDTRQDDLWSLSFANGLGGTPQWTRLSPAPGPAPIQRDLLSAVYDDDSNQMIMFAGRGTPAGSLAALNDLWRLSLPGGTANQAPTTSGIADIAVDEDAADDVIDLFAAFDDAEDPAGDLIYTLIANTNPSLFASTSINGLSGELTLDYAADENGVAELTVRATDTGGLFVDTSFTVTVAAVNDVPELTALTLDQAMIFENETVTLDGSFADPDLADEHTVTINWGDGTIQVETLTVGVRAFSFPHQYLDDGDSPGNGSPQDDYTIEVTLSDGVIGAAAEWDMLEPTGPLISGRIGAGTAYDPATNLLIVHAGGDNVGNCGTSCLFGDSWTLDNANGEAAGAPQWTQLSPSGTPPFNRWMHGTAYDAVNNRLMAFGGSSIVGFCGGVHNDTWVLADANGSGSPTWTQLNPTGALPAGRRTMDVHYDDANNRMLMHGGGPNCGSGFNDTWVLENANGLGGTPHWTQLSPTGTVPSGDQVTGYDAANNRLIVWSGSSQLFILENANGLGGTPHWTQPSHTGTTPFRFGAAAVYDATKNELILFGGIDGAGRRNETFVLEHANGIGGTPNWIQLAPDADPVHGLPANRSNHEALLDPASGNLMIFAGTEFNFGNGDDFNDVWVLRRNGSAQDTDSVILTVKNQDPLAADQNYSTDEEVPLVINVLAGSDDGGPFSATDQGTLDVLTAVAGTFATAEGGSVTIAANGAATYTPAANFFGLDSFVYTVEDDDSGSDVGTVAISVAPINDVPELTSLTLDQAMIFEHETVTLDGSFSDPDLTDVHTVTIDWGDGTIQIETLATGDRTFSFPHQYLDDGPSPGNGSTQDLYEINVTLSDGAGGSVSTAGAAGWTQLAPSGTAPAPRNTHTAIYAQATDRMVIFGGRGGPNDGTLFNDSWRLLDANGDGSPQWEAVSIAGGLPTPRWVHQAAYDSDSNTMIVHGGGLGFSSPCSNQTYALSNADGTAGATSSWSLVATGGPAARFGHTAVYDDANDRLMVFAGSNCFSSPSFGADVWVLADADGIGTPTWTQLNPGGSIVDRASHTAAYDAGSNRMIVYGGINNSGISVLFNDVHVLTSANGLGGAPQWIDITPASGPAPPAGHSSSIYDADDNRLVIFGGALGNAVWVLQNANGLGGPTAWTEITPTTGPAPRSNSSIVFDAANDRLVMFGGNLGGSPTVFSNEVWTLNLDGGFAGPTLLVKNVEPDFEAGPTETLPTGATAFSRPGIAFTDPGTLDVHTVTVDYDGDAIIDQTINVPLGDRLFDLNHTYSASGTFTVSVTLADDDGGSLTDTFDVTVVLNTPPTTNGITDVSVLEDAADTQINLFDAFDDAEDADAALSYTVQSNSNAGLVSTSISAGTLSLSYAADDNGAAEISVRATDTGGLFVEATFTVTVTEVNDPPSFTAADPPAVLEDAGPQTVSGWSLFSPGPADEASQTVVAYMVSVLGNSALFAVLPAVSNAGTLTYTPAADANGSATFAATVTDNGGTANGGLNTSSPQTFTVTVVPVNDAPSFTHQGDQTVNEDSGGHTVSGFAAASPGGGPDEASQTFTYNTGNDNPGLFSLPPSIDSNGQLTYTLAADASGVAVVTVSVTDSGGTANGGVATSPAQTFQITVLTAEQQTEQLVDDVQALLDDGTLSNGQGNPLLNFLDQALKDLDKGKVSHAIKKLNDFIDRVQDLIDDGNLSLAEGQPLIDLANGAIQSALPGSPLLATPSTLPRQPAAVVTEADLQTTVAQAIDYWFANAPDPVDVERLRQVSVHVAELPGNYLGAAGDEAIWIDRDAAGYGWADHQRVNGGMDLFTAVAHELGHLLGLPHDEQQGVMRATLDAATFLPVVLAGNRQPLADPRSARGFWPSVLTPRIDRSFWDADARERLIQSDLPMESDPPVESHRSGESDLSVAVAWRDRDSDARRRVLSAANEAQLRNGMDDDDPSKCRLDCGSLLPEAVDALFAELTN